MVPAAILRGSLHHGLLSLLRLRDSHPERFESAAVAWHARWCQDAPAFTFAQDRAVLDALEMLASPEPASAAARLRAECERCELEELSELLDDWAAAAVSRR